MAEYDILHELQCLSAMRPPSAFKDIIERAIKEIEQLRAVAGQARGDDAQSFAAIARNKHD